MKTTTDHRHSERLFKEPADLLWHLLNEHGEHRGPIHADEATLASLTVAHQNLHAVSTAAVLLSELTAKS